MYEARQRTVDYFFVSPQVRIVEAFEAEESGSLDLLIRNRKPEDLAVLRTVARNEEHHFDAPEQRKALYALGRWGDRAAIPDILGGVARP